LLVALSAGWAPASTTAQSVGAVPSVSTGSVVPLVPAAGRRLSGSARVLEEPSGELWLQVSVTGPADELARAEGDQTVPNLLWMMTDITCSAIHQLDTLGTISGDAAPRLLGFRTSPASAWPDALDFRVALQCEWLDRPFALAARRNGGGPLYACADLRQPPAGAGGSAGRRARCLARSCCAAREGCGCTVAFDTRAAKADAYGSPATGGPTAHRHARRSREACSLLKNSFA